MLLLSSVSRKIRSRVTVLNDTLVIFFQWFFLSHLSGSGSRRLQVISGSRDCGYCSGVDSWVC